MDACCYVTLYFCVTMLRLYGFSWIFSIAILQFFIVSLLMMALVIFQVSKSKNVSKQKQTNKHANKEADKQTSCKNKQTNRRMNKQEIT